MGRNLEVPQVVKESGDSLIVVHERGDIVYEFDEFIAWLESGFFQVKYEEICGNQHEALGSIAATETRFYANNSTPPDDITDEDLAGSTLIGECFRNRIELGVNSTPNPGVSFTE